MGRASVQKHTRNSYAFEIAGLLLDRVDRDQVNMTGQLFPRGGLKKPSNRRLMDWVHDKRFKDKRMYTKALLKLTIKKILRDLGNIPRDPDVSYGTFCNQQAKRLKELVRRAKRIKARGMKERFFKVNLGIIILMTITFKLKHIGN